MSGAFNIDIEVGQGGGNKKIKIYCASLTDTWEVERDQIQLAQFYSALGKEETIVKNKINLGQCPKTDNIPGCELFLSRLGCTASVLRISRFHDFLQIPQSVRDGLTYASHKPFGKTLREGYLQRHPRNIRRGGGKRWIRLTKEERGGSLICYLDENNKNSIISSLKIGASTELQALKDRGIPNAFVLRSGKRQWVLQASSNRDYTSWQSALINLLKEFGPINMNNNDNNNQQQQQNNNNAGSSLPSQSSSQSSGKTDATKSANTGKLLKENQELTEKIKKIKLKINQIESEIDRYRDLEIEMKTNEQELKRKGQKLFQREKEDLIAEYEVKQDNLRGEIEELHQNLEQKTADEGSRSGLKSLFGDDFLMVNIDDYKDGVGINGNGIPLIEEDDDDDDDDEQIGGGGDSGGRTNTSNFGMDDDEEEELNSGDHGHFKYLHKHLHRHDHKHIHEHRHIHIHDQTGDEPITYTHTHTIAHTITHTMTQFKIKKNTFGGI